MPVVYMSLQPMAPDNTSGVDKEPGLNVCVYPVSNLF